MDLMCPKHNEPLNVIDRPLPPMPAVPPKGGYLRAELGLAYCGRCDARSKKRSPSTQFAPAFFNPVIPTPNSIVAIDNDCKRFCCPGGAGLRSPA